MVYTVSAVCRCETGKRRRDNQDNFYFDGTILPIENNGLGGSVLKSCIETDQKHGFAIFDGMGGMSDGQIAAEIAAKVYANTFCVHIDNKQYENAFIESVLKMNGEIWSKSEAQCCYMGTTATIIEFYRENYFLCNIGDSPAFLFRNDKLAKISTDHIFDSNCFRGNGPFIKPSLTQYVGMNPDEMLIEPSFNTGRLCIDDVFLICSDGLTDMLNVEEIESFLQQDADLEKKLDLLMSSALNNGGKDNITIILCNVNGEITDNDFVLTELQSVLNV